MKKFIKIIAVVLVLAAFSMCFASCGTKPVESVDPVDSVDTTGDETTENTSVKSYLIYSDNAFAPFEYYDSAANAYVGLDMDILAAIAEDQNFTYEVKNEGFDASMGAVQSGQADAMIAGMTITEKRKETFDFSEGYFEDGQILVVKTGSDISSVADLAGKTVAAKTSTMGAEYAAKAAEEYGFQVVYYEDSPTMYTAIVNGTNDACFEDRSVIGWAIKESNLDLVTVGDVINPGYYGFAVKKGQNAELIELFNKGLENIRANGKYDEILAKYGY